ncbi:transglutaminase TgpA family protein [Streptomyces xinghaiensis]|uniref:transglutaminase TgpA family protein n=1 Tax=Streptomyces xinghaiensis TaxID=1038928 RepID=UPI003421CAE6
MSGRGRLAVSAALATLLAACSLLPLVKEAGWLPQAAFLLAAVSGAGALARRAPLPRPLTALAQLLVALALLTWSFARGQAVAWLLPGPDAFREFALLLSEGAQDIGEYSIPAPVTPGIRLMLVGGVLSIGLLVDVLAVTYRAAAPAGLPLLALYSVAAGLDQGGSRWLWFLLAAVGYLLLLLAEGRDRLSQWGRVFSGAPPAPSRLGAGLEPSGDGRAAAPLRTGRRIGAVTLGIAMLLPAVMPSLGDGLLDGQRGTAGSGPGAGTITTVNPLVSLQNSLNQPENREVLSYRTNAENTRDLYLRIVALDQFDGSSWKSSERPIRPVPDELPPPPGLSPEVATARIDTSVSASDSYRQSWLPMPYPATRVEIGGRWSFEPEGRTLVGNRRQTTRGAEYRVSSLLVQPTAAQLAAAGPPPADLLREYTEVPDSLPPVVARTARDVTEGASGAYEKAVRLQDWFASEGGFVYDTQVEAGSGSEAIANFLEQKEGFCVHFSFSMAAMARTLDIPARVAVGFTPGTASANGTMSVGLRDAHAWPELYFENIGWVRFEPTPSRGTVPDYTVPDTPESGTTVPDEPEPVESSEPSAAPSDREDCPADQRFLGECQVPPADAGSGATGGGLPLRTILLSTAAAVLLLGLPLLPVVWRTRVRGRRLGGAGKEPRDPAEEVLAAWRELIDSAWDHGFPPDDSQTPRRAAERIVAAGGLEEPAAESVRRVAGAVEQVLYAPVPRPAPGLADDVRRVRAALRAAAGRGTRLRALFAPRSAVRVVWACSRRWWALTERWSAAWATAVLRVSRRVPSRQRG